MGRVPLRGDTENVILFTEGLEECLLEVNGGIPDFSPGFGLDLVKEQEQHFRHLYFPNIILFPSLLSPDSLLRKVRQNVFLSGHVLTSCLSSRDSEI